jgi:hypothetical protein
VVTVSNLKLPPGLLKWRFVYPTTDEAGYLLGVSVRLSRTADPNKRWYWRAESAYYHQQGWARIKPVARLLCTTAAWRLRRKEAYSHE